MDQKNKQVLFTNSQKEDLEQLKKDIRGDQKEKEKNTTLKRDKSVKRDENGRFLPGHSPISSGRPEGSISITKTIKKKLAEMVDLKDARGNKIKKTYLELIITKILNKAIKDGDAQMIKQIWNYVDGMPKQSIEQTGESGGPLELDFRIKNIIHKAYAGKQSKN